VQEKGQHVVYLVTEAVRPLSTVLRELNLSGKHRYAIHTSILRAIPALADMARVFLWVARVLLCTSLPNSSFTQPSMNASRNTGCAACMTVE